MFVNYWNGHDHVFVHIHYRNCNLKALYNYGEHSNNSWNRSIGILSSLKLKFQSNIVVTVTISLNFSVVLVVGGELICNQTS